MSNILEVAERFQRGLPPRKGPPDNGDMDRITKLEEAVAGIRTDISALPTRADFSGLQAATKADFAELRADIAKSQADMHKAIADNHRWTHGALVGIATIGVLGVIGMVGTIWNTAKPATTPAPAAVQAPASPPIIINVPSAAPTKSQ